MITQYLVAVAEALSFRRAAERCRVAQPSLSAQIALVESSLGIVLFGRARRRVLVTPAGQEVIDRARDLLRDADDLVALARRSVDPLAGPLHIGVIPTISPYLLPRLTPALRAAHPRLTLRWTEDRTAMLVARLGAGELDAALLALEADLGEVEHEVIGVDPFVLAVPRRHPLAAGSAPASAADLAGASVLLLDDGHCFREQALAYCTGAKAEELAFRATSLSTLAQMVAAGAGVTLLPALAVPAEAARAKLVVRPLGAPCPKRTIALIWRRRSPLAAALRQLARTARGCYPDLERFSTTTSIRKPTRSNARPGKHVSSPSSARHQDSGKSGRRPKPPDSG